MDRKYRHKIMVRLKEKLYKGGAKKIAHLKGAKKIAHL
jgi:hypothetical protein